jgi:uncharacterized protein YyaL (SSP411 family)
LLAARGQRVRPNTDDKVLVSWNSLAICAFAEAGRAFGREDYVYAATRNADFILTHMVVDGKLQRSWRQGAAVHAAYLEDYAGLALALLSLYQADPQVRWYQAAIHLAQEMVAHFSDPSSGFFDTRDDHEPLLYRPKDVQDNAIPSGNSLAAELLLRLATFEGISEWRSLAESSIQSNLELIKRYPSAFGRWLCALDFAVGPVKEVAIVGSLTDSGFQSLQQALWQGFYPRLVLATSYFPPPVGSPALLSNRPLLNGKPTAYVCQGFVCQQPVNDSEALKKQLS